MKKVTTFLAVFLLFTCHVQSYAQQSENAKKTFIGNNKTSGRVNILTGQGKRKKYLGVVVK